jgi:23S rRNA C2498 (ribose-2'-O)-methylase RlmM
VTVLNRAVQKAKREGRNLSQEDVYKIAEEKLNQRYVIYECNPAKECEHLQKSLHETILNFCRRVSIK